jgi:hypothetical protein
MVGLIPPVEHQAVLHSHPRSILALRTIPWPVRRPLSGECSRVCHTLLDRLTWTMLVVKWRHDDRGVVLCFDRGETEHFEVLRRRVVRLGLALGERWIWPATIRKMHRTRRRRVRVGWRIAQCVAVWLVIWHRRHRCDRRDRRVTVVGKALKLRLRGSHVPHRGRLSGQRCLGLDQCGRGRMRRIGLRGRGIFWRAHDVRRGWGLLAPPSAVAVETVGRVRADVQCARRLSCDTRRL